MLLLLLLFVLCSHRQPVANGFISEPSIASESPGVKRGLRNVTTSIVNSEWVEQQSQANSVLTLFEPQAVC